jgi:hypothetical protein
MKNHQVIKPLGKPAIEAQKKPVFAFYPLNNGLRPYGTVPAHTEGKLKSIKFSFTKNKKVRRF